VNEQKSDKLLYSYLYNPNSVPLRCYFYGVPTPNVTISKDGKALASSSEFVQYDVLAENITDFGDYLCTGKNIHGIGTHTIQLKQAGKAVSKSIGSSTDITLLQYMGHFYMPQAFCYGRGKRGMRRGGSQFPFFSFLF